MKLWKKMRATEENVRSIHENTRRLKHDMRNHLMVIAMSLGNEKYDELVLTLHRFWTSLIWSTLILTVEMRY